jgi:nitroreductase
MDLDEAIQGRRAIRKYQDREIPDAIVSQLLALARCAPSSMNGQPWHFVVVREPATKRTLAELKNRYCPPEKKAYRADFLEGATILVLCIDLSRSNERTVENAVLAASVFMLAAHSRGLGTVYMSAYQAGKPELAKEIGDLLELPKNVQPVSIIPFGYPAEQPAKKDLRELKETIHFERY